MLHNLPVLKSEDVEEDTLAEDQSLLLSKNVVTVLKGSHHFQMTFARKLTDVIPQSVHTVGGVRAVFCVSIRIYVFGQEVQVAAFDTSKQSQDSFDVACCHCISPFAASASAARARVSTQS